MIVKIVKKQPLSAHSDKKVYRNLSGKLYKLW